jgi:hypothetical protein
VEEEELITEGSLKFRTYILAKKKWNENKKRNKNL